MAELSCYNAMDSRHTGRNSNALFKAVLMLTKSQALGSTI